MALVIPRQEYTGSVRAVSIGAGARALTVGGETAFPFYTFEGQMPHAPRIGLQVLDHEPEEWAAACLEPYQDVLGDPVAWARKAQDRYQADFIQLWLKSTDPNGLNRSSEEAARTARAVAEALDVPLIIWGTSNVEKDAEVLSRVAEACAGLPIIIGPVTEGNYKQLGAQALAYNLTVVANSPIDINLAKQLNILLQNLGVPLDRLIIDPTTGGLGYGLEYSFSVMERIRHAALTQNDDKLQCPFISNLADEVWKCREAKLPSDVQMGDAASRGILMEAITATTLLHAGADLLVMRHPQAVQLVRTYLAELGGFRVPIPAETARPREVAQQSAPAPSASRIMQALQQGSRCRVVTCMDAPAELGPDYAIALLRLSDNEEADAGLVLEACRPAPAESQPGAVACAAPAASAPAPPAFEPQPNWVPLEDQVGDYAYALQAGQNAAGQQVNLIQESYDPGRPEGKNDWRAIADGRDEQLQRVRTDLRYWYAEGYGSEKRKKPA